MAVLKRTLLICVAWAVSGGLASGEIGGQGPQQPGGRGGAPSTSAPPSLRGRLVTNAPQLEVHPIEVRLEDLSTRVLERAYTDGVGNFSFLSPLNSGSSLFFVIEVDGFKPIRQRVEMEVTRRQGQEAFPTTVFLERSDVVAVRRDRVEPSAVDLRQLLADIPEEAIEEFREAADESEKGNYVNAAEHLEKAVELAPDYYDAQNALGVEYTRLGRYRDAERALVLATELNPNVALPLINLGLLYLQVNDLQGDAGQTEVAASTLERAVELLERAAELEALSTSARYYLGAALYRSGSFERAALMLDRALELDVEMDMARLILVDVQVAQRDYRGALAQLTAYLERNPEDPRREAFETLKAELEGLLEP